MAITSASARVYSPIDSRVLALDGEICGAITGMTGGSIYADFVSEKIGPDHLIRKHLAGVKYEDISLEVGLGMSARFYDWIKDSLQGKYSRKNGEIYVCDHNQVPRGTLSFSYALLSEVSFPKLDAASKDAAKLAVKLSAERIQSSRYPPKPGSKLAVPNAKQKKWLASNFRLEIDGLDCKAVNKVSPPVARQAVVEQAVGEQRDYEKEPSHRELGNLAVTLSQSHAESWFKWHEEFVVRGNCDEAHEKNGRLVYLSPDLKTELFSLELSHLGIFRLHEEAGETGSDHVQRIEAEMYCEQMELTNHGAD